MFISLRPSTCVMGLNVNLGSFGVIVVNFDFHLKCNNSSIFHSIFMLLIQMHKLQTLNLFWGSKVNLGSFGVIEVKF